MVREAILATPPEPTDADIARMTRHADAWRECPATRERLVHINEMAADFYERRYPDSWARAYLHERFGDVDDQLAAFRPGYAPDAWTSLTNHLHHRGVTDEELLAAGLATTARTGRLIDRFRDRVVFPIVHEGDVLGFVGRRNPTRDSDKQTPKYLNTPETALFHKGDQLYMSTRGLAEGVTPVIVEGPMDAIAIDLCGDASTTGVAPLGTALTEQQLRQLYGRGRDLIIATDNDLAGQEAAERAYWLLCLYACDPRRAVLPDGADPADLARMRTADALAHALEDAPPLSQLLVDEILASRAGDRTVMDALQVLAARAACHWTADLRHLQERLHLPLGALRQELELLASAWNADPRASIRPPYRAAPRTTGHGPASAGAHLPGGAPVGVREGAIQAAAQAGSRTRAPRAR